MINLLDWLLGRHSLGYIANWTPAREQHYTRETYKYLGIRQTAYTWSRKYRPKAKLQPVEQFGKQRSA